MHTQAPPRWRRMLYGLGRLCVSHAGGCRDSDPGSFRTIGAGHSGGAGRRLFRDSAVAAGDRALDGNLRPARSRRLLARRSDTCSGRERLALDARGDPGTGGMGASISCRRFYPVFLSLFVRFSDAYVHSALVGQIALNALSVVGLFTIGAALHSRRAGLIAAFIYAFWITNIWTWPLFMQEQIYVPLLIVAFALLLRATAQTASVAAFAWAGAAFGFAALTRSMPMYYVVLFAMGYPLVPRYDPKRALRAGALVVGFLLVTGPYSVWISQRVNQFAFIENHGGISVHLYGGERPSGISGSGDIVRQLFQAFASDPRRFLETWSGFAMALFHVHGDRWLQNYDAPGEKEAVRAKVIAHAGIDAPFVATVCTLRPLARCWHGEAAKPFCSSGGSYSSWRLSALSAAGGVRYRSPFEPHLIALASVVLAGNWRHPGRTAIVGGTLTAVAAATILAVQLPRVARGKANYGIHEWSPTEAGRRTWGRGSLGINVLPGLASCRSASTLWSRSRPPSRCGSASGSMDTLSRIV